jgi:hypothetical protein
MPSVPMHTGASGPRCSCAGLPAVLVSPASWCLPCRDRHADWRRLPPLRFAKGIRRTVSPLASHSPCPARFGPDAAPARCPTIRRNWSPTCCACGCSDHDVERQNRDKPRFHARPCQRRSKSQHCGGLTLYVDGPLLPRCLAAI